MTTTRDELISEARRIPWFHAIDFGDFVSPGRSPPGATPNSTILPVFEFFRHIDFTDKDCLDIGTADGIVAFVMKQKGARRVVATDGGPRRPFEIARALLGLDIEYDSNLQDVDLPRRLLPASFDVIVMAGFLYHLFAPLAAIAACRNALRPGGLLITETVYTGGNAPTLTLNTELDPPLTEQNSTYFIPTKRAVEGMLKLCCFDVLASASLGHLVAEGGRGRIAHVARATSPELVRGRTAQLISTHTLRATPNISFADIRKQPPRIVVPYLGAPGHTIVPTTQQADWIPFQPTLTNA